MPRPHRSGVFGRRCRRRTAIPGRSGVRWQQRSLRNPVRWDRHGAGKRFQTVTGNVAKEMLSVPTKDASELTVASRPGNVVPATIAWEAIAAGLPASRVVQFARWEIGTVHNTSAAFRPAHVQSAGNVSLRTTGRYPGDTNVALGNIDERHRDAIVILRSGPAVRCLLPLPTTASYVAGHNKAPARDRFVEHTVRSANRDDSRRREEADQRARHTVPGGPPRQQELRRGPGPRRCHVHRAGR